MREDDAGRRTARFAWAAIAILASTASSAAGGPRPSYEPVSQAPATAPKSSGTETPRPAPTPSPLPERQTVGGLRSIDASSTVVYAGHPELIHRLQATYAFPARSRWWLGTGDEGAPVRRMLFESGASVCELLPNANASRELAGEERATALMQLGMRRALFAWPHGAEWKRVGDLATTALGDIGVLEAHFATRDAVNPDCLSFRSKEGQLVDEFRAITWSSQKPPDKSFPTHLELWHAGEKIWTEDVVNVDTRTRIVDSFFVPPDRRDGVSGRALEVGAVRAMDLPEQRTRRFVLPAEATWDSARGEYGRLAARVGAELEPLGLSLEARATFEVSDTLKPTAVILRLAPRARALAPEVIKDWPLSPERPAMATFVMGLDSLDPGRMIPLREAVPADARAGTPYVRFEPTRPNEHVLIVLPIQAKDG